ncbi:hypothetical protein AYO44_01425 [Planctomycetaceae bacterium SCGC AG-212-F19]|nr:hypothetical protein AYO44_01425 [Planctomycetaceae bacterium SCGC AG-212-F19]
MDDVAEPPGSLVTGSPTAWHEVLPHHVAGGTGSVAAGGGAAVASVSMHLRRRGRPESSAPQG